MFSYLNIKYQVVDDHRNYQASYFSSGFEGGDCKLDVNIYNCVSYHAITVDCQKKWCRTMAPDGSFSPRGMRVILEDNCTLYELYYQNLDVLTGENEEYRIVTSFKESGSDMLNFVAVATTIEETSQVHTKNSNVSTIIKSIENGCGGKSQVSSRTMNWMEQNSLVDENVQLAKTAIKNLYDEQKGLSGYYKKKQAWLKGEEKEIFQRK